MERNEKRAVARQLAARALAEGDPLGWFDELYQKARDEGARVPWADMVPNPHVVPMVEDLFPEGAGRRALKIGCGYGDDAEWLVARGFAVTAFDISPIAIAECRRRFPGSPVDYVVADLFSAPPGWREKFDLVWESYTLQVLPPELRREATLRIPDFLADDGRLFIAARARSEDEPEGLMPWPITRAELAVFSDAGLKELFFEDYVDTEDPPVRRFRACFKKGIEVWRRGGENPPSQEEGKV